MKEIQFVKKAWYRVSIHSGKGHKTFVGQCISAGPSKILKGKLSIIFEIGHESQETKEGLASGPAIMWISEEDVISAKRLSPRYIEIKETRRGKKIIERYDSPDIAFGEE
jgi:hypothetical protein